MSKKVKQLKKKVLLSVTLFFIIFSIMVIVYLNMKVIRVTYVDYDFKIKGQKHLGFNAGTDALHFGIIAPGGTGIRDLELTTDESAVVLIKVIDHDFIHPNKNNFILEPGNKTLVQFIAKPTPDYPIGNYSGKIRIVFKRA